MKKGFTLVEVLILLITIGIIIAALCKDRGEGKTLKVNLGPECIGSACPQLTE